MSEISINKISYTDTNFEIAQNLVLQVFVLEQGVNPKLEMDRFDKDASHFLLLVNEIAIGTARWRTTEFGVKLERFAILKDYRKLGYGSKLVKAVLSEISFHHKTIYLNSQLNAVEFYKNLGFETQGSLFEEAGIQHYKMLFKG